jgi:hypothetical protein
MKYFKSFIEDYNTATMPSSKFYNYERWEMLEYKRAQEAMNERRSAEKEGASYLFDDEMEKKAEIKRLREKAEIEQFELVKSRMIGNKDKREDMRHQEVLRAELKLAYKQGDSERVQRLERVLAPDEITATVKHPWA